MGFSLNAEQNQEVTLARSRFLSGKVTWGRNVFYTLVGPFLKKQSTKIYQKITVLNTFKHKMKNQYNENLAGCQHSQEYYLFLVLFLTHLLIYCFIHLSFYLFIYLFFSDLFLILFFYFSFTYLPLPLPSLTINLILFIMYPFCYRIMFLICCSLYCSLIIYLIFIYLLQIN